jgi:hypothetical protein
MQNVNNTKSGSLIQLILKPQIAVSLVVAGLLVGCGGGGGSTTPTATTSYTVSVVDDNIVGSTLTATGCAGSTDNKNGTYTLSGCSAKPVSITATGGFIDTNGNGSADANEATQDSPLVLNTAQATGTTFNVTPLTTLAHGLSAAEITTLKAKLGGIDLFGKEEANKELRQTVNALLAGATESGLDVKTFGAVLAQQINQSTSTGVAGIKEAIATIKANPSLLETTFGKVKITGFLSDGRVTAVGSGTNVMTAMLSEKVPDGKIRISGFIYDKIIVGASVTVALNGTPIAGVEPYISDTSGKYFFDINEALIPKGKTLQFIATKTVGSGENIKLTSLVSTDKVRESALNNKTNASTMGDLIVSNVTTAKAVVAQTLNPTVLTDGTLDSTMLKVESGYADTVVKVAGAIKYIIDDTGTTGTSGDTLAYAQTIVTSTGGTTGITTDHSNLVTGDVVLNGQLSTEIAVVAPTAVSGIAASKAMFQELRTQALSLVDYKNSGTPGFIDTKALAVQEATRDVAGADLNYIVNVADGIQYAEENTAYFTIGSPVKVIEATLGTQNDHNYYNNGQYYKIAILGDSNWYNYPDVVTRLIWGRNGTPHSLTLTRTATGTYSYTIVKAGTTKTTTGTVSISNQAVTIHGDLPNGNDTKMNVNVTGSAGLLASNKAQFTYSGTAIAYNTAGSVDSTFTLNNAVYTLQTNTVNPDKPIWELLSLDGKFEMKTYTLTGKVTASNYIDIDNGHGQKIHVPKTVMFDGKALDSFDGSYISGLVNGSITNTITNINNALFDISFTGKLNVPSRPLTTVILTMKNIDADKANVTLSYTYDKTKIDVTGAIADLGTVDGTHKYTAQLKNQAGVTIDVLGDATGKNVIGIVSKDGIKIGTIDMLSKVPRVIYYDGTFETLI